MGGSCANDLSERKYRLVPSHAPPETHNPIAARATTAFRLMI